MTKPRSEMIEAHTDKERSEPPDFFDAVESTIKDTGTSDYQLGYGRGKRDADKEIAKRERWWAGSWLRIRQLQKSREPIMLREGKKLMIDMDARAREVLEGG